jgi:acetyl esterase/lipase
MTVPPAPAAPPGLFDPITEQLPAAVPLEDVGSLRRAVPYAVRPGFRPLQLDLYQPAAGGPHPVVLFLHGGGWRLGSRAMFCPTWRHWQPDPFARLVAAGFTVVSAEYRLSGEAVFPAQLDDVTDALRWIGARADELGVDPERAVVWGESAGGHLAALLGLAATRARPGAVAGVVDWYGPSDLTTMAAQSRLDAVARSDAADSREALLIGAPIRDEPGLARAASPVSYVHPAAPPFHIAHGTADRFVPAGQSKELAEALHRARVPVELHLVEGADHMWQGAAEPEHIFARALDFARRVAAR